MSKPPDSATKRPPIPRAKRRPQRASGNAPVTAQRERLALTIAQDLADEILNLGWPVGRRLGTEAELMARFNASRESFREGVRILELQGLIRVERGARGGLIIEAPASRATASQLRMYLSLNDISAEEILSAQFLIKQFVGPRAVMNATPAQILELRGQLARAEVALLEEPSSVDPYFAINEIMNRSSGHPVASVFSDAMILSTYGFIDPRIMAKDRGFVMGRRRLIALLRQMVDAFANHDSEALVDVHGRAVDEIKRTLEHIKSTHPKAINYQSVLLGKHPPAIDAALGAQKSALKAAYSIAAKIRRQGLEDGAFIGSQKALMQEGGFSFAVFREAMCLLEYFGRVEVRHGPHGGMFVSAPNPRHTIAAGVRYLRFLKVDPTQSAEFRRHILRSVVQELGARMSFEDVMHVRNTVAACGVPASNAELLAQAQSIERGVLGCSTNRAVRLIAKIMLELQAPPAGRLTAPRARRIVAEREKCVKTLSDAFLRADSDGFIEGMTALLEVQ